MIKRWLGNLALRYCHEILLCEHQAALLARDTLLMGVNGYLPLETAVDRVINSLEIQLTALEALIRTSSRR
jgi:hypothetical protein